MHLIIDILLTTSVTFFLTLRRVHSKRDTCERTAWWRFALAWCHCWFDQYTFLDIDDLISWAYALFAAYRWILLTSWLIEYRRTRSSTMTIRLSDNQRQLMKNFFLISSQCFLNQQIFRSQHSLLWSLFSLLRCESFWELMRRLRRWQFCLHSFCLNEKKMFWIRLLFYSAATLRYHFLSFEYFEFWRQRESFFSKKKFLFLCLWFKFKKSYCLMLTLIEFITVKSKMSETLMN